MKSALSFYKISQRNLCCLWPMANCPLPTSTSTCGSLLRTITIPSLTHLAAARTLAAFVPKKTYYEVLDLRPSATTNEIRQAFLKLSKLCHPDAVTSTTGYDPDNHKKFIQVNEAYSVLSKPLSRRNYDATLNTSQAYTNTAYPHSYGYQRDTEPYIHYNGHQRGTDWRKAQNQKGENVFTNFLVVTSCLTCATLAMILHYTYNYIPDPKFSSLRKSTRQEIEQHELIMTSEHEGMVVHYYAVPKADDPKSYEVLAVMGNQVKDSDTHELQELNKVNYSRQHAL